MKRKSLLLLLLAILSSTAVHAYNAMIDGICYNFSGSNAIVTYETATYETWYEIYISDYYGDVVIPSSVTYNGRTYRVSSIGDYAFNYCKDLTSVSIPSSVKSISGNPFTNCSSLTSINVDSRNTVYDSRNNCNAIIETATNTLISGCQNTTIPENVRSIGGSAFSGCSGLTSVTIPEGVTSIGNGAFYGCSGLTSVTIPEGVTSIGNYAFEGCSGLTSITIPEGVTSIGNSAFYGCNSLETVYLPKSVTYIGDLAFASDDGMDYFLPLPSLKDI